MQKTVVLFGSWARGEAVSAIGTLHTAAAVTHGFRSAFAAAILFALVGLVIAVSLLGRRAQPLGQPKTFAASDAIK